MFIDIDQIALQIKYILPVKTPFLKSHNVVCPFILFLLAIVLSILRFTDSDCPFGIFKLFLQYI